MPIIIESLGNFIDERKKDFIEPYRNIVLHESGGGF